MPSVECPDCQTINEVDFGLTPCSTCGRMLVPDEESTQSSAIETLPEISEPSLSDEPIEPPPPAPTFQSIEAEMNETGEKGLTSDLPFSFEVLIRDLHLPERVNTAIEIVSHPHLHVKIAEATERRPLKGELVVRGLNAFQASNIVSELLRNQFRVSWKQVFNS